MTDTPSPIQPTAQDWKGLKALLEQANAGDASAVERLRAFLDENPQVWRHLGDLAAVAEHAWLTLIAHGDVLSFEAIRRELAHLKESLVGVAPSVVEKMLGDSVLATWLELRYLESVSADAGGGSRTQGGMLLKRLESSQRRHLAALKSLVQTRKLLAESPQPSPRLYNHQCKSA
jgi:hypothetical protein